MRRVVRKSRNFGLTNRAGDSLMSGSDDGGLDGDGGMAAHVRAAATTGHMSPTSGIRFD